MVWTESQGGDVRANATGRLDEPYELVVSIAGIGLQNDALRAQPKFLVRRASPCVFPLLRGWSGAARPMPVRTPVDGRFSGVDRQPAPEVRIWVRSWSG